MAQENILQVKGDDGVFHDLIVGPIEVTMCDGATVPPLQDPSWRKYLQSFIDTPITFECRIQRFDLPLCPLCHQHTRSLGRHVRRHHRGWYQVMRQLRALRLYWASGRLLRATILAERLAGEGI